MNKKIASPHYESQPHLHDNYITDAINALYTIPSELPRDEWLRIAAAFKAAGGEFELFDNWSSTASNYNARDAITLWKSLSDQGGIGIGTLFFYARQYGYRPRANHAIKAAPSNVVPVNQPISDKRNQTAISARQKAETILNSCVYAPDNHPYLLKKRINHKLKPWLTGDNRLVIPVMDLRGNIHSLHFIDAQGNKLFLKGGVIKGNFYQIWSSSNPSKAVVICEGYATGVTLASYYVPDCSVVIAFNAGNLKPVAQVFRDAFPDVTIIIAGDNDRSGTGQKAAEEAALAVGGSFTLPVFQTHESGSDFNDRWCLDNREVSA